MMDSFEAERRLEKVLGEIKRAAAVSGRRPEDISLLAVSKTFPAEDVAAYLAAGQKDFGESYIQEAREKIPLAEGLAGALKPRWHFIGHLQSNKAKFAALLFEVIHSLDSSHLARELDRHLSAIQRKMEIFIEVNVSGEAAKSGLAPAELPRLLEEISSLPSLQVKGLMTMPPYDPEAEKSRPYFAALRELRDRRLPGGGLSMGMSGDFTVAVEEGATVVRVGSALFGSRG